MAKRARNTFLILFLLAVLYIGASLSSIATNGNNFYAKTGSGTTFVLKCSDPAAGLMEKTLYRRNGIVPSDVKIGDLDEVSGYPTAIAFADDQTGFITVTYHGQDFSVYMTDDGGKSWQGVAVDIPDDIAYNYIDGEAVSFDDNGEGTLILDFVSDERVSKYEYHFTGSGSGWEAGDLLETASR